MSDDVPDPVEAITPPESDAGLVVGRTDRLIALRQFPAFEDLAPEDTQAIALRARERRYAQGEEVLREQDPVEEVAFIIRGRVQTSRGGKPLRTYGPRSVIGSVPILAELGSGYGCRALERTTAVVLPADELLDVFEEHFAVARGALQGLASQILELRRGMAGSAGFHPSSWEGPDEPPPPLDLVGRIAYLRDAMPFAGARMEALADLARDVREARLDAGDVLWRQGDESDAFLFLLHGRVDVKSDSGMEVSFGPGDVVGSLGTLAGSPRWFDATCGTSVVALRLEDEALFDVMEDHFDFTMALIRSMARGYLELLESGSEPKARLAAGRTEPSGPARRR